MACIITVDFLQSGLAKKTWGREAGGGEGMSVSITGPHRGPMDLLFFRLEFKELFL